MSTQPGPLKNGRGFLWDRGLCGGSAITLFDDNKKKKKAYGAGGVDVGSLADLRSHHAKWESFWYDAFASLVSGFQPTYALGRRACAPTSYSAARRMFTIFSSAALCSHVHVTTSKVAVIDTIELPILLRFFQGDASLQNLLEMACTSLRAVPEYGNREVGGVRHQGQV